jgi:hypothetical protein
MSNARSKVKNMVNVGQLGRKGKETKLVIQGLIIFLPEFSLCSYIGIHYY